VPETPTINIGKRRMFLVENYFQIFKHKISSKQMKKLIVGGGRERATSSHFIYLSHSC
jgi:hypothetical protein